MAYGNMFLPDALVPIFAAMGIMLFFFIIAVYIYGALALMKIAKKLKTEPAWLAWIPIANFYLMVKMVKWPWWTFFAIFLPIIPILGNLALIVVVVMIWWNIAEALKRPGWFGILMIVPIVNLVVLGIMAWGKK